MFWMWRILSMEQKNKKVCRCGRIIIDSKNISGLCPRCQKTFLEQSIPAVTAGIVCGVTYLVKEFGPAVTKGIKDSVSNLKNELGYNFPYLEAICTPGLRQCTPSIKPVHYSHNRYPNGYNRVRSGICFLYSFSENTVIFQTLHPILSMHCRRMVALPGVWAGLALRLRPFFR